MITKTKAILPSAWELEFSRLIAFPTTPPRFIEQRWWHDVTSQQPPDFASKSQSSSRDDRGTFDGTLLSLTVDHHRIIWETRSPKVVDQSGNFPTLGPFRSRLTWFSALLSSWLRHSCPPLLRIALSAKLLQKVATASEAYRILKAHLPAVDLLDSDPNDFALQINRRKKSSAVVNGLPINRFCTWSKMNRGIVVEPGKPFEWPEDCYSVLELDINTAPERADLLPAASLPALFNELASLGVEIAEHGDVP